jgi:predicted enzyme related to lactoylglutathione lyase
MSDRKLLPGKFVWFELVCRDTKRAQAFYGEVFAWKAVPFPMGASSYDMIFAGETPDTMIGGYAAPRSDREPSHWISYVSVEDVDATAKAAAANGGRIVEAPSDIPTVGRRARIADPQGGELCLFKRAAGDPPDLPLTPVGRWVWNELHTRDTKGALAFYEKVLGFSHRSMDMGPGGAYHLISRGGVDRGGVTSNLAEGDRPHWLPYVHVDDADATVARATKLGARIPFGPESIPGVGRVAAIEDPTGANIAIIKPSPRPGA